MAVLRDVHVAREQARVERERQPARVTRRSHPDLTAAAKRARRAYVRGEQLANAIEYGIRKYEDLDERERELHQQYHSGAFKSEMIDANKAFGDGVGVDKSLSVEQIATLELSLKEL